MADLVPWFSLGNFDHFDPNIAKILGFKMPKIWKRHQFKDIMFGTTAGRSRWYFWLFNELFFPKKKWRSAKVSHQSWDTQKLHTTYIQWPQKDWNLKKTCVFFSRFVFFQMHWPWAGHWDKRPTLSQQPSGGFEDRGQVWPDSNLQCQTHKVIYILL